MVVTHLWKVTKFMSQVRQTLSRQHPIFKTGIGFAGTLGAIALLTACSQPVTSSTPNLNSAVPNPAAASVKEKPLLSQRTDTPSETTPRSCRASDLKAVLDEMQGAVGSRYGVIKLTNSTDTACILQAHPQIQLLDSRRQLLPAKEGAIASANAGSKLTVQAGQDAYLRFRWSNWCQKGPDKEIQFAVNLPNSQEQVPVTIPEAPQYHDTPPCNGSSSPSVLSVGEFKPSKTAQ